MTGPFETQREALDLPAVKAIFEAFRADPGVGKMAAHTHQLLMAACTAAGVSLGAYDRRVLAWLSGFEPQTAAVIAGLIARANDAGASPRAAQLSALADSIDERLDNENADRQTIAEDVAQQLRDLAGGAR